MKGLFFTLIVATVCADAVTDLQMLSRAHYAGPGDQKISNYLTKRMQEEFDKIKLKYSDQKRENDHRKLPIIVKTDPYSMSYDGTFSQPNQHGGSGAGNSGPVSDSKYQSEKTEAIDSIFNDLDMGEANGNLGKDARFGDAGANNLDKNGKGTIGSAGANNFDDGNGLGGKSLNPNSIGLNGAGTGDKDTTVQMSKLGEFDSDADKNSNYGGARLNGADGQGTIASLQDDGGNGDKSNNLNGGNEAKLEAQNNGLGDAKLLGEGSEINLNHHPVDDQGQKLQDPTGEANQNTLTGDSKTIQQTDDLHTNDGHIKPISENSKIEPVADIQTTNDQLTGGSTADQIQLLENDPNQSAVNLDKQISISVSENADKLPQNTENTITEAKLENDGNNNDFSLNSLKPTLNAEILETNPVDEISNEGSIFTKKTGDSDKVENLDKTITETQEGSILSIKKPNEEELVAKGEEQGRRLTGSVIDLSKVGYFWNMASGSDQPRSNFLSPRYLVDHSAISVNKLSFNKIQNRSLRAKPSLSANFDRLHPALASLKKNKIRIDDAPLSAVAIQTITGSGTDDDRMRSEFETVTSMTKNELMLRQLLRE